MIQPTYPTLVFEWVTDLSLLISCQGVHHPTDAEWDDYLACIPPVATSDPIRVLVLTEGGRPTRAQQRRLEEVTKGSVSPVAVVSKAGALRFVVSVLSFANPNIQSFHPSHLAAAVAHIGLSPSHDERLQRVIDHLQRKLTRPLAIAG